MSNQEKTVLVIGCSDAKLEGSHQAFDLYQGGMYQMLKKGLGDALEYFTILILSAEYGLVEATDVISSYNKRMPTRKPSDAHLVEEFSKTHSVAMRKLLKRVASEQRDLYVIMSNDYLNAFDIAIGCKQSEKILKSFRSAYVCRGHRGVGDLRGSLTRAMNLVKSEQDFEPVYFRSGVANDPELGFVAAGCATGGSLAYLNTEKSSKLSLLSSLLESAKHAPFFLDNGIITKERQKKVVNPDWVFDQYEAIIGTTERAQGKNISIVVPDDVRCNEAAVAIVRKYKKRILALSKKCTVILPVHRSKDIRAHALNLMAELNFETNIRLGVPCLQKGDLDFSLPSKDIDALLAVNNPKTGERLFQSVHFFGMSEATSKLKLSSCLKIAEMHQVETFLDCCRTTAIFGKLKSGKPRAGSALQNSILEGHKVEQAVNSDIFIEHTYHSEYHEKDSDSRVSNSPVYDAIFDLIQPETILDFIKVYNELVKSVPAFEMRDDWVDGEFEEACEFAWELVNTPAIESYLFEAMKKKDWKTFYAKIENPEEMDGNESRFLAIKEMFGSSDAGVPIQLQLQLA